MSKVHKTMVVNIKTYPKKDYVFIGRGSPFGNPYVIGKDGDRDEVIKKYERDFYKKIKNERFKRLVLSLKGKKLGCFCKPEKCHGDIIVQYLEGGAAKNGHAEIGNRECQDAERTPKSEEPKGAIQGW